MERLKNLCTAVLLIAGVLCISIPLAAGAHRKLVRDAASEGGIAYQSSVLSPDFPVFQPLETR